MCLTLRPVIPRPELHDRPRMRTQLPGEQRSTVVAAVVALAFAASSRRSRAARLSHRPDAHVSGVRDHARRVLAAARVVPRRDGQGHARPARRRRGRSASTIDAASVDTRMPARDVHLKSERLFDVAQLSDDHVQVVRFQVRRRQRRRSDGELTMHGVTKPVKPRYSFNAARARSPRQADVRRRSHREIMRSEWDRHGHPQCSATT